MASFKNLSFVIREFGFARFAMRIYSEINADNVFTYASAMAYAWIFAIFPLLLFLLTLVPYLPKKYQDGTEHFLEQFLYESGMPWAVTHPVVMQVHDIMATNHKGLMSLGLLLTLYAASGGMNTTMSALDAALDIEKPRSYIVKRLLAILLTVVVSVCFLLIVCLLPIGATITNLLMSNKDKLPNALQAWVSTRTVLISITLRYVVSLIVMQVIIGLLYTFGPSKWGRFRFFTPGSIFAASGWIMTGLALRFYFSHFSDYSKTYGAVAGMVIMLTVFYLDAIIILVGAEIDSEIDCQARSLLSSEKHRTIEPFVA